MCLARFKRAWQQDRQSHLARIKGGRLRSGAAPGSDVGLHAGCQGPVQPWWLLSASNAYQGSQPAAAMAWRQDDSSEGSHGSMIYSLLGLVGSEAPAGQKYLSLLVPTMRARSEERPGHIYVKANGGIQYLSKALPQRY